MVNVDDHADTHARTVTVFNEAINLGFLGTLPPVEFIQGLAPGTLAFLDSGTNQVNIDTGTRGNTVNILSTGISTSLVSHGSDAVNIGFTASSVQGILGALSISNVGGQDSLNIDDHLDKGAQKATLSKSSTPGYGSLTCLAPATIKYQYAGTKKLTIETNTKSTVNVVSDGGVNTFVNGKKE